MVATSIENLSMFNTTGYTEKLFMTLIQRCEFIQILTIKRTMINPLVLLLCQALQNKPVKEHTKATILCAVILCRSVLSCFNL